MDKGPKWELAPLRSLSDFLLESARFQVPTFTDWEQWGNRITCNLLYYQTNYFLTSVIMFLIFGLLHPVQMVSGCIGIVTIICIFCFITAEHGAVGSFKTRHPLIAAAVISTIVYYVVSWMTGSLIIFVLSLLIPFCAIFIHASLRLRNIKNKVVNAIEPFRYKHTPMGVFLEQMGLQVKQNSPPNVGSVIKNLNKQFFKSAPHLINPSSQHLDFKTK